MRAYPQQVGRLFASLPSTGSPTNDHSSHSSRDLAVVALTSLIGMMAFVVCYWCSVYINLRGIGESFLVASMGYFIVAGVSFLLMYNRRIAVGTLASSLGLAAFVMIRWCWLAIYGANTNEGVFMATLGSSLVGGVSYLLLQIL
jgi:hypothetical protein